ncbi:hypothetical protein M9H77_07651 [Catharanthus roseus]|uniref:Uncharacterized protein n=1 Tax=Catharanthus roseus TaxID=4058 RepID=A0ACC0BVN5_CATRO|nr:hypothetical protein M9H77_07651 [Catharanthus roseus]
MKEQGSSSTFPFESSRHSFAHSQRRSFTEASEQSSRMPNLIHVHHTAPIPEVSTSPPSSPTASQMKDDSSSEHQPDDFQDFSSTDDGNISSPYACKVINMIRHDNTVKDQKELIFDIIQDLPPEAHKKQLEKLKALILREESSSVRLIEPFSISKMFDQYPNLNPPIRQHSTTELQTEIRSLKAQVKELKERVFSVETKNLELDTQIALLQSRTSKGKEVISDLSIPDFPIAEIPMPGINSQDSKFISIIDKITFQKWNIYVTISIRNFKATFTAMLDSGADQSCIRDGLIPTKYYVPTNESLVTANGMPLQL